MKNLCLIFSFLLCAFALSAQKFNPIKDGYTAIDTLRISEYTYYHSIYFISDTRFIYYDFDSESTDDTGVHNFYLGIYDVEKKQTVFKLPAQQSIEFKFAVSPSGKHLVVLSPDGADFYKIEGANSLVKLGTMRDIICNQTQVSMAFYNDKVYIPCNNSLTIVKITDSGIIRDGQKTFEKIGTIWSVAVNDAGDVTALGCSDGAVHITSPHIGILVNPLKADVTDIVWSKEKCAFICASGEGIASVSSDGQIITSFELEEGTSGNITTLSQSKNGYFIVGSFDYPHKLISIDNALKKESYLDSKNYVELEKVDWPDGGLYFDFRAVGTSPGYKYLAVALPWRNIVILKKNN